MVPCSQHTRWSDAQARNERPEQERKMEQTEKEKKSKNICHNKSEEPITHRVNGLILELSAVVELLELHTGCTVAPEIQRCTILALALIYLGLEVLQL